MKYTRIPLFTLPLTLHAGDITEHPITNSSPQDSGWVMTSAFYAPLMGLEGSVGLFGLGPFDVDSSFTDVLDVMDAGLSGAFELRNGPWTVQADAIWLKLSDSTTPLPGSLLHFNQEQFTGSLSTAYNLYASETTSLRLIAGAAISHIQLDLGLIPPPPLPTLSNSGSQTWIDPFLGIGVRHSLSDRWTLFADGLYGGFGVSSEVYWQVVAGVGYQLTENTTLAIAYRTIAIDYTQAGFVYDTETSGPNIGVFVRF